MTGRPSLRRLPVRATVFLVLAVLGALIATLGRAFDTDEPSASHLAWLIDLAAHWQWVYLPTGLLAAGWLLWRGYRIWPLLALPALVSAWVSTPPTLPLIRSPEPAAQSLTVASANIHLDTQDLSALYDWAVAERVDVLVLLEVTPAHVAQLNTFGDFEYRLIHPDYGPFGVAILSRLPLHAEGIIESTFETPVLRARVEWKGRNLALSAAHPMPPLSPAYHQARASMLEREAKWGAAHGLPAILAGDLNATPWSNGMRVAAAHGLLRSAAYAPSWPSRLPLLPIDHVLASPHWSVLERQIGPDVGSDHRPVLARLAIRETSGN